MHPLAVRVTTTIKPDGTVVVIVEPIIGDALAV